MSSEAKREVWVEEQDGAPVGCALLRENINEPYRHLYVRYVPAVEQACAAPASELMVGDLYRAGLELCEQVDGYVVITGKEGEDFHPVAFFFDQKLAEQYCELEVDDGCGGTENVAFDACAMEASIVHNRIFVANNYELDNHAKLRAAVAKLTGPTTETVAPSATPSKLEGEWEEQLGALSLVAAEAAAMLSETNHGGLTFKRSESMRLALVAAGVEMPVYCSACPHPLKAPDAT